MTNILPATTADGDVATIGVELYGDEHHTWLGGNTCRGPQREPDQPTIVRRRGGRIVGVFSAAGTVSELDDVAAQVAPTWTARHVPAVADSKIWACPQACGYHIADGPVPDGEPSTLELIQEHLDEHERETVPPPGPYAEVAAELHRIADALAAITGGDQLALDARVTLFAPWRLRNDEAADKVLVDQVAVALTGGPGAAKERTGGDWYYEATAADGAVDLWVYSHIADPTQQDKDAELERLRAEIAALKAAQGGAP